MFMDIAYPKWILNASNKVSDIEPRHCVRIGDNSAMKNKIKEFRERAGLSQEQLGKFIGHQKAAVQKIEKKPVEKVTIGDLFAFAHGLGTSPWELIGFDKSFTTEYNAELLREIASVRRQLSSLGDIIADMTKAGSVKNVNKNDANA